MRQKGKESNNNILHCFVYFGTTLGHLRVLQVARATFLSDELAKDEVVLVGPVAVLDDEVGDGTKVECSIHIDAVGCRRHAADEIDQPGAV